MSRADAAHRRERAAVLSVVAPSGDADALEDAPAEKIIERAAEAAREMLGMDMAYVADTRSGLQDYRAMTGDGESFGAAVGQPIPLEGTYCERVLDGRLGNIVRDASTDP